MGDLTGKIRKTLLRKKSGCADEEEANQIEVKKPQASGTVTFDQKNGVKPQELKELPHKLYLTDKHVEIISDILYILDHGSIDMGHLKPTGVLLNGPPGVGKTVIAKHAVLRYMEQTKKKVDFLQVTKEDPSQWISSTFKFAREHATENNPAVILIDEIDSMGTKDASKYTNNSGPLSTLLMEMDGISGKGDNVLVIATTNYIENVDYRLMRSGRIDKVYEVGLPDLKARKEMLKLHIKDKNVANPHKFDISEADLEYIAKRSFGYTPADIKSFLSDLFMSSGKKGMMKPLKTEIDYELKYFKPTLTRDMLDFCEPEITLENLVLEENFKNLLKDYVLAEDSNILLYGPKGCGKSTIPEALAGSLGYRLIKTNAAALQEGIVGESQKKIGKIFERAKQLAPTILFVDELEGIVELKGMMSHKADETSYINSYLADPIPGVTVVATTNNPLRLNDTTLSRFEPVYIGLPTKTQISAYVSNNGLKELDGFSFDGYSFRDLTKIEKSLRFAKKHGIPIQTVRAKLERYPPENTTCETNWDYVKDCVGGGLI